MKTTEIRRFNQFGTTPPKTYSKAAFTPEVPGQTAKQIREAARKAAIDDRGLSRMQ
jgi:hypothetical protein